MSDKPTQSEKQRQRIEAMTNRLAKEKAKLLLREQAERRRLVRDADMDKRRKRAALFRQADAHKKIVLGGLTIAAGADGWDEGEIVGALLYIGEQLAAHPEKRAGLREKGVRYLADRKAEQEARK